MVFSSIPAYLDPANWQQQPQNHHHHQTGEASSGLANPQLAPPQQPPQPQPHGSGGGAGSIRPGSMADRARMANIPMPETALKCPRCESTNTKFCYFNNYSLTQPRHFCKTCRRYWTRGGALRNVPVGGGCRRNKRSKGSNSSTSNNNSCSSKSPVSGDRSTGSASTSHDVLIGLGGGGGPGGHVPLPPLRFMGAPLNLHNLTHEFATGADIGLNYGAISAPLGATDLGFHIGSALAAGQINGGGGGTLMSSIGSGLHDQWRFPQQQQFPTFLGGGLESSSSGGLLYPFDQGGGGLHDHQPSGYGVGAGQVRPKISSGAISGLASTSTHQLVKMEDNNLNQGGMNLARQFMGVNPAAAGNDQYWNNTTATNSWTDLSSFSSSSTSNPL